MEYLLLVYLHSMSEYMMTREYSLRLIKMEVRHVGLTGHANEKILLERICIIMATDMEFIGYINTYVYQAVQKNR